MRKVLAMKAKLTPVTAGAALTSIRKRHLSLIVQLATFERFPTGRTVEMIAQQTIRAEGTGSLLATKPEVDLLLRLAGTTQIAVAIKDTGYGAAGKKLLVAAGPPGAVARLRKELEQDPEYSVLEEGEVDAEGLAMVERAALLGTRS